MSFEDLVFAFDGWGGVIIIGVAGLSSIIYIYSQLKLRGVFTPPSAALKRE